MLAFIRLWAGNIWGVASGVLSALLPFWRECIIAGLLAAILWPIWPHGLLSRLRTQEAANARLQERMSAFADANASWAAWATLEQARLEAAKNLEFERGVAAGKAVDAAARDAAARHDPVIERLRGYKATADGCRDADILTAAWYQARGQ